MRAAFLATVLVAGFFALEANAQMRGGGHVAMGGGRSAGFAGRSAAVAPRTGGRIVTLTTPGANVRTSRPFTGGFPRGIPPCFGINCFNRGFFLGDRFFVGARFGRHRFINNGFGFGFAGFPWAYGGWGWPYYSDYSGFDSDQQQQYERLIAQNQQLQADISDDQRRELEYQQQLADLHAAEIASRNAPQPKPQAATTTDRELPPTVLVYRDHHQEEVRNYAIAGNTIFDLGPHWTRKIAVSDLDIPATVSANEERGVRFSLPGGGGNKSKQP